MKQPTLELLGNRIKEYREKKNLDQDQLGLLAWGWGETKKNAAQLKVSRLERGKMKWPRIEDLIRIANTLDIHITDLLK